MQVLDTITAEAKQKHTILLEKDNTSIVLNLTYKPTQLGWFLDVEYDAKDFKIYGLRVTTNSNILNQWRNILPFGIICYCEDSYDPLSLQDFVVGRAHLAILNEDEVQKVISEQRNFK